MVPLTQVVHEAFYDPCTVAFYIERNNNRLYDDLDVEHKN